jgi:hypothetical protein
MEGNVDGHSFLAYASVVNMKVGGILEDERTIAVQSSPAVAKRNSSAVLSLGRRTRHFGLLGLGRQGHLKVLECLKPNWVQEDGEGEREGRG